MSPIRRDSGEHREGPDSLGFRRRPRKRFGQHFLSSEWAQKVVNAIAPERGDVFLAIGPGTGALTMPLAGAAHRSWRLKSIGTWPPIWRHASPPTSRS